MPARRARPPTRTPAGKLATLEIDMTKQYFNAAKTYAVMTSTGDGTELWKENLGYQEAQAEIEQAKAEFGGKYWMEEQKANPLHHIPDCTPR